MMKALYNQRRFLMKPGNLRKLTDSWAKNYGLSSKCLSTATEIASKSERKKSYNESVRSEISRLKKSIRRLKSGGAESETIKLKIAELTELRASIGDISQEEEDSLKTLQRAKGTRDFGPATVSLREKIVRKCVDTFETHCAVPLDTPVFELTEVMDEKYSDSDHNRSFIYDLKDTGGEFLSLRYDLTVPFARYLASKKITTMRRYQIGKVYRKETPRSLVKGRLREFTQADFDIAGRSDQMITEAECMLVAHKIFNSLGLRNFIIKVNHRGLVDAMLSKAHIPVHMRKRVCGFIDSLDKKEWAEIRDECSKELQLSSETMDQLEAFIMIRRRNPKISNEEFLQNLKESGLTGVRELVRDLDLLLSYCRTFEIDSTVILDPSLVRGLDYYTGTVFEVALKDSKSGHENPWNESETVAAGGRYDNLVEALSPVGFSVPCIGLSIGIDRILAIIEQRKSNRESDAPVTSKSDVFVCSAHRGITEERLRLTSMLWKAGIKAQTSRKSNPSLLSQFQVAEKLNIPLALVIGSKEIEEDTVLLRDVAKREEKSIPRIRIVDEIKRVRNTDKWALKSG